MRLILLVLFFFPGFLSSQNLFNEKVNQLISADSLPPSIRSGKSLVLIEITGNSEKEWKRITEIAHTELIRGGIDPVAYYPLDLIYSGVEVTRSFVVDLSKREFNSIIMIKYDGLKSIIALTSFTPEFFKGQQQEGWKREGELKNILNQLYIRVANSSHKRKNFLISEQPEDGLLTGPIKGRRAEFFSLSVKGTKMAVPVFNNPLQDQELKAVLDGEYPFDFVLVDPSISEEELKKDGFQYVLYNAHSQAKNVHDLLGYESDKSISVYATIHHEKNKNEVRTIPLDQYVYKYYLKHLISGTTYLGTEWDVSATWRQALLNHLRSYKKGVGIN